MNRLAKAATLLACIGALTGGAWGQSAIPKDSEDYLFVSPNTGSGDQDRLMVAFFEVPATMTDTIYFAINSPGYTGAAPDENIARTSESTNFYLIGGSGAISDARSRQEYYPTPSDATAGGTTIQMRNFTNEAGWHYFNGVSPSEGELIGNKRYFKVVAWRTDATIRSNAFQLNVSLSGSGTPSGVSTIRAFAYSWSIFLDGTNGNAWDLYPFVPEDATGNIRFHNWDADGAETWTAYDIAGTRVSDTTAIVVSGPDAGATTPYPIGTQRNGTWNLHIVDGGGGNNGISLWHSNSGTGEIYRTYATSYTPAAADHVAITLTDGLGKSDGIDEEIVTIQIVDASGNPVPYARDIFVSATDAATPTTANSARINGTASNTALVATNGDGYATFTVTNTEAETVTIALESDGTGGASALDDALLTPGANGSGPIVFSALTLPSIASTANNTENISQTGTAINNIVVTENEAGTLINGNSIRIQIPTALTDTSFTTTVGVSAVVTGTGSVGAASLGNGDGTNDVLIIPIGGTNFTAGSYVTISGVTLTTGTVEGSGRLTLSVNGGTSYPISDTRVLTVTDTSKYVWYGTADQYWGTPGNWSQGAVPPNAAKVVIPPTTRQPILNVNTNTLASLTIDAGATLTAGTFTTTTGTLTIGSGSTLALGTGALNVSGTVSNSGTVTLAGTQAVTLTGGNDIDSGTWEYTGTGGTVKNFGATDYYNLTVNGTGTTTLAGATAVANTLTVANGTLAQGGFALNAATLGLGDGDAAAITNNAALTVSGTATINTGAGNVTLENAGNSFGNPVILTSGGAVSVYDSTALSARGTAGASITLASAGAVTQAAALNAPILRVSAAGGITLNAANTITSVFCASNATSGDVSLTNTGAISLGDATLASVSTASGGTVTISNTGAVIVAQAVSAGTGTVTIDTGGAGTITQGGAGLITADTINLQTGASSTGAVGANGAPILTATSNLGTTTTTLNLGQGSALLGAYVSHTGALTLGAPSLATDAPLEVVAAVGLLTLPAAAIDTGTGELTLSSGTALTTAGNLTSSASIALTASAGALTVGHALSGGTVTLASTGGATILSADITTTGDAIDLSGAASIVVGAAAVTLDSGSGDPATAGAITFGAVPTSANGSPYALVLDASTGGATGGAVTVGNFGNAAGQYVQNLTIDTTGATTAGVLTDTAARTIVIPGTLTLDIGAQSTTTLLAGGTSNAGTLTATSAGSVTFSDANGIVLGASVLGGNLTVTAVGTITQSGAVSVAGTSSFTAGTNAITLTTGTNDFGGAVAFSNSGANDVQISDTNAVAFAASSTGGNLTVIAGGNITDSGNLSVTGNSSFTAAGGSSIILDSAGNAFTGTLAFLSGGTLANVTIADTTAVAVPALSISGNLSVTTTDDAITQSGALSVAGTSTFNAGANTITLTTGTNDFGGAVAFSNTGANDVQITDADDIGLGLSSTGGNLTVIAGGAITDSGTLSVTGVATFETHLDGGANITIDDNGALPWTGDFGSIILRSMDTAGTSPAAGSIVLREASATVIDGLRTTSTATIQSAGAVTDSAGAVLEGSLATISVGGATLDSAANALSGFGATNTGGGAILVESTAALLTVTGITQTGAGDLTLSADDLAISGAIGAGTNAVSLYPYNPATAIFLGGAGAGFQLSDTELDLVTTSGLLTIGDTTHTGAITISAAVSPALATGGFTLVNRTGGIDIRANLGSGAALTLTADGGGVATGAITRSTAAGTLSATGLLTLHAAQGIGVIGTSRPVEIGAVGSLSAVNTTSGDIFLSTTGAVTVDATGFAITAYAGATVRVDGGGNLTIGGDITVNSGTIILNAASGTITRSGVYTLTASNVALGTAGTTTGVGTTLTPIRVNATAVAAESTGGAQGVYIDSTGAAALTVGYSGEGLTTTGNNAPITLTAADDLTVSQPVSANGTGAVTLSASAAGTTLTTGAAIGATTNGVVSLRFDAIAIGAAVNVGATGTANAYLYPFTSGTDSSVGGSNPFDLADAELDFITAGTIFVGRDSGGTVYSDAMTVGATGPITIAGKNISIHSLTDIQGGANALTCAALTLGAASGIGNTTPISSAATTISFANSTSNAVSISNGGSVSVTGTNSATGAAITVAATSGTLTVGAGGIAATGTGAVNLTANDMTITGTATAGSNGANLTTYTAGTGIFLGGAGVGLSLSDAELDNILTAGTLTIGGTAHTGGITINGDVALSGPTGPVVLGTDGGTITATNAFATAANGTANLTLDARTGAATTGIVTGAGQLTAGNLGAATLAVDAGSGISLTNAGNRAATVTLTNSAAAGNIVYYNNRNTAVAAANSFPGGNVTIVNGTGTLSVGATTSTGAGYVSLSSAGAATQSAVVTAPGGLLLLGAGSFALNTQDNAVSTVAANTTGTGAVSVRSAAALAVGTVNGTNGVTTAGGSVTLTTAAGDLTLSQPVDTDSAAGGTVSLNPTGSIVLDFAATPVVTTGNAAVNLQRPVTLGENTEISSGTAAATFSSTVDDETADTHTFRVSGNAVFQGNIGTTRIASLRVTGTAGTGAAVSAISTNLTQQYDGTFTLGAGANLTASTAAFNGNVAGGGFALTVTGAAVIGDAVGDSLTGVSTLSVTGDATINAATVTTTTGGQTFGGNTTLGNGITFTAPAGQLVRFNGTLGGGATAQTVAIAAANARFGGAVGGAGNQVTSVSVAGTTALYANVTTTGTQTYTGTVTLFAASALTAGAGAPAISFGGAASVEGTFNLTLSATGTVSAAGTVGATDALTVLRVANSNGTTFTGAVRAATFQIDDSAAATTVSVGGDLTLTAGMTVAGTANAYNVSITGGANSIAGTTNFANTGTITVGQAGGDTYFIGGASKTNAGKTFAGTIRSNNAALDFGTAGTVSIPQDTTFNPGSGTLTLFTASVTATRTLYLGNGSASTINTAGISGATASANVAINTTGVATIGGAVGANIGTLTVTNSGGTTFQSTVSAATVTLTDTTGTIEFDGALTVTTGMSAAAAVDNISLNQTAGAQTSTIAGAAATSLANTGTLTIGNDAGDIVQFTAGLTANTQSGKTVYGALRATGTGAINLGGAGSISIPVNTTIGYTSTGQITLAATQIAAGATLTVGGGAVVTPVVIGAVTESAASANLTVDTNGAVTLNAVTLGGTVDLRPRTIASLTQAAGTISANLLRVDSTAAIGAPLVTAVTYLEARSAAGVNISQTGNLTIGGAGGLVGVSSTGTGNIQIVSTGTITTAEAVSTTNPGSITLQGTSLTLTGGGLSCGSGDVFLQPTADGTGISINDGAAGFYISEASLQNITTTGTVTIGRTGGTGAVNVGSQGAVDLSGRAYNLTLRGSASSISFNFAAAGNSLTLGAAAGRTLALNAGGAISSLTSIATSDVGIGNAASVLFIQNATSVGTGAAPLTSAVGVLRAAISGSLYVSETDDLVLGNATSGVTTSGGVIDILVGGALSTGNDTSASGTVDIEGDSIALSNNVASTGGGTVTLTAGSTSITRSAGTISTTGVLTMSASTNIGGSGTEIATNVATLQATASAGGIYVNETNGLQLGGASGVAATGGNIVIVAGGAVTTGNTVSTTTSGDITITAGAGTSLTISNDVTIAGAASFTGPAGITVNGGTLSGGSGAAVFNNAVTHSAGTITAGQVAAVNDALRFTGNYNGAGGTLNGNGVTDPDLAFQGNVVFGTFTHSGDRLRFYGAVDTTLDANGRELRDVRIDKNTNALGVVAAANDITQTGAALILAVGYLDLETNGIGWIQDSGAGLPPADAFTGVDGTLTMGSGAELRCGDFSSGAGHAIVNATVLPENTITASGDVSIQGTFSNQANSTLVMTGAGTTLTATPQIGDLTVDSAGTVQLGAALSLADDLTIDAGVLDVTASNYKITVAGDWDNLAGAAGFLAQAGEVEFVQASGTISISGSTDWFDLTCTRAGVTIAFQNNRTQTILPGGTFTVTGTSGSRITLTRQSTPDEDLNWVPPAEPNPALMWQLDVQPPAGAINMQYVLVKYSDARAHPVVTPDGVDLFTVTPDGLPDTDEIGKTCYKWLAGLLAVYSYTEDADADGRIDRLRVRAAAALNGNFSGFAATVNGYEIDTSIGTNGYVLGGSSLYFYIYLVEKTYPDSNARPTWLITANTTLKDGAVQKYTLDTINELMTPVDTAPPVPAYTMALPGRAESYIRFSEPAYAAGGAVVGAGLFGGAASLNRLVYSGNGTTEALLGLASTPTVGTLAAGATMTLSATINDNATAAPVNYFTDTAYLGLGLPEPEYPTTYGNYAAYSNVGLAPPNQLRAADQTHRISDVLISVPPAAAADATYFVWPVWARDSVSTEIPEDDYETLSGEDAASLTVGLVRDFTGTQWLRDQNITLEARVNPALSPSALRLHYDTAVSDDYIATTDNVGSANASEGLWLPIFSEAAYSALVPEPKAGTVTVDGAAASAPLWDFAIDSKNPKITTGVKFDFFFTLGAVNATDPLYAARLDIETGEAIPAAWYRRVLPFSFDIHDVKKQRSNVTILNNVINPTKGERTRLSYQLRKSGRTTIQVFTLDGDLVKILYRGNRAAGDYTAIWDGKNQGGRSVARGIYFIRIVAPEIDEIRKVMVVK